MPPRLARLAGVGAFAACVGLVALYALLVYLTRPMPLSGIDLTSAIVVWISLGGVFAALIVLHVAIGRQLLRLGRASGARYPL